ncbi:hypothetical protein K438DRAFT_1562812 [Mycena galopus ATCC 62051]|nr:hypothetical protein K438DRAFT_1562812 [Mycena galopus ATCC 62051]
MLRRPKLILDCEGRIVAVLLGRPDGDDWEDVMNEARRVMDRIRACGERQGVFVAKKKLHRCGKFYTLRAGFTKGPGQKKPGNLAHLKDYRRLLNVILKNRAIRRMAGFQSSGLARYLPKLYRYHTTTMKGLCKRHPELERPFQNSVYPTVTLNLGPDVVTPKHLDMLNNPFSMCAVTAAGNFDHTLGGHIFMKQLKVVCEFPSGSTILLLSGTCAHGNTPIQLGERRYSMTQYAVGALFRWAEYGYQSTESLSGTPDGARQKREIDGEPGARAAWVMGLLSKAHELEKDREEVFGGNSPKVPLSVCHPV